MIINAKKFRNVLSNFGRKYILIKYIEPAKKILTRYRQITFFMVYIISLYLNATNDIIIENIIDIKNITILSILVKINIKGMHPITEARNILESFV